MFTPNTLPLILVVLLIYFILLIAPTSLYVEAAREKGYYQNKSTAYLYVIAAFFTPFTVGYWSQVKSATPKSEINRQSRPI